MLYSEFTLDTIITRNEDMFTGEVDSDIMMMSVDSGKYYLLNPVGGEIWDALQQPLTFCALCDILESKFSAERSLLEKETLDFLVKLLSRQIISIA